MRRILLFAILILWAGSAWGADYNGITCTEVFYFSSSGDGSAPETIDGAWDEADFNTAGNWDSDDSDDGKLGPNDCLVFLDDDGDFSGTLTVQGSGLENKPITFVRESGGTPIITMATDKNQTANWTVYSGSIWYITSVTTETANIILNYTACGVRVQAYEDLNAQGEWWYDDYRDRLYIYSSTNPATYYDDIKVVTGTDSGSGGDCIYSGDKDYLIFDGLTFKYGGTNGLHISDGGGTAAEHIEVRNCTFAFIGGDAASPSSPSASNLVTNGDMEAGDPPSNWNQVGTLDTWASEAVIVNEGSASAHIDGQTAWDGVQSDTFSVTAGTLYYVQADVYLVDSTDPEQIRIVFYDGGGASLFATAHTITPGSWNTIYTYIRSQNSGASASIKIDNNGNDQEWYLDDVQVKSATRIRRGNGIQIWGNQNDIKVHDNIFYDIFDAAMTSQEDATASVTMQDIVYYNNITWNSYSGFELMQRGADPVTSDVFFVNNIVNGCGLYGWATAASAQRWQSGTYATAVSIPLQTTHDANITVKNNIFNESSQYLLYVSSTANPATSLLLDNNCWYQNAGTDNLLLWGPTTTTYTYSQFSTYQGDTSKSAAGVASDPLFKSATDFHLQPGSPCLGTGTPIAGIYTDFDGWQRRYPESIGAYADHSRYKGYNNINVRNAGNPQMGANVDNSLIVIDE